jgi:hypothetical protein
VLNEQSVSEPLIESSAYQSPAATFWPSAVRSRASRPLIMLRLCSTESDTCSDSICMKVRSSGRSAFVGTRRSVSARMSCSPSLNSTRSRNGYE